MTTSYGTTICDSSERGNQRDPEGAAGNLAKRAAGLFARVAFTEQEKARVKELFAAEYRALEEGEDRAGLIAERHAITAVAARRGPRQPSPEAMAFAKALGQQAKEKRRHADRRDPERGVRRSGML